MKANILFMTLLCAAMQTTAQDLQSVQRQIAANDYSAAKKDIDQLLTDRKNEADPVYWFYKGKVYTEMSRQEGSGAGNEILKEAFEAFRRYQELDPKNKLMQLDNNIGLFQLYDINYNNGVIRYNEQDYHSAYFFFRNALELEEYINRKGYSFQGYSFPSLDTSLVNLTGSAAFLSKKEAEAIPYFERLADAKITGEDYKGIYSLLVQYHFKKNNTAKGDKYLVIGRELFPDPDYWISLELANMKGAEKLARYEKIVQRYPDNFRITMDYAIELFNYIYTDSRPADYQARQDRLQSLLLKALSIDENSLMANYVMSQHVHNQIYFLDNSLRSLKTTGEDDGKKINLQSRIDQKYEELFKYSRKSLDLYEQDSAKGDKDHYKKLLTQMVNYYQRKKRSSEAAVYQEKLNNL